MFSQADGHQASHQVFFFAVQQWPCAQLNVHVFLFWLLVDWLFNGRTVMPATNVLGSELVEVSKIGYVELFGSRAIAEPFSVVWALNFTRSSIEILRLLRRRIHRIFLAVQVLLSVAWMVSKHLVVEIVNRFHFQSMGWGDMLILNPDHVQGHGLLSQVHIFF